MADPQYSKNTYDGGEGHSYPFTSQSNSDEKQSSYTAYTALDDTYDPTNVGKPRAYVANADPTSYHDKGVSYSDDVLNPHSQEQAIDESPVAPLVRGVSNKHHKQYQDLGVFQ